MLDGGMNEPLAWRALFYTMKTALERVLSVS